VADNIRHLRRLLAEAVQRLSEAEKLLQRFEKEAEEHKESEETKSVSEQQDARTPPPQEPPVPSRPSRRRTGRFETTPDVVVERELRWTAGWMGKVGAIALIVGTVFLLKFLAESRILPAWVKVMLGVLFGGALCYAGEFCDRKGLRLAAHGLLGSGLPIVYASIYAGYTHFNVLGALVTFLLLAATSMAGLWLANRHRSLTTAIVACIGAYLVVLLVGPKVKETGLFVYIVVVSVTMLALGARRRWNAVVFLSWCGFLVVLSYWTAWSYPPTKGAALGALLTLTLAALLYTVWAVAHRLNTTTAGSETPFGLWVMASSMVIGGTIAHPHTGWSTYVMIIASLLLAVFILANILAARSLLFEFILLSSFALLVAANGLLSGSPYFPYIGSVVWCAAALALTASSKLPFQEVLSKVGGAMSLVGALKVLFVDSLIFTGASLATIREEGMRGFSIAGVAAGCLVIAACGLAACFERQRRFWWAAWLLAPTAAVTTLTLLNYLLWTEAATNQTRLVWLSILWALCAAGALSAGIWFAVTPLRIFAVALFVLTVGKVFLFDTSHLSALARITAFLVLGTLLLMGAFLYQRYKHRLRRPTKRTETS